MRKIIPILCAALLLAGCVPMATVPPFVIAGFHKAMEWAPSVKKAHAFVKNVRDQDAKGIAFRDYWCAHPEIRGESRETLEAALMEAGVEPGRAEMVVALLRGAGNRVCREGGT